MLLYHPAFDIYHCVFRMLRILSLTPKLSYEVERLRIFDFYLLFPSEFYKFTFPNDLRKEKSKFRQPANPYQQISDPKRIFLRLEPYQVCALKCLASRQFIDADLFLQGKVVFTGKAIPETLTNAVQAANAASPALVEFMSDKLSKLDLYGASGLKGRSDLFEYRYDIANATTGA